MKKNLAGDLKISLWRKMMILKTRKTMIIKSKKTAGIIRSVRN